MQTRNSNPLLSISSALLIGLSLSIGWGIRGNFGHEYGAAFAGCLAAISTVVLSGREDWRQRVAYFAFFGAIGWGFGATQSYMQVISYTESGHATSQLFGYLSLFILGFLWAALGGAGTAFAAVAKRETLVAIFNPLLFVFASWLILDLVEDPIARLLQEGVKFDDTWARQKNPLYWFDSDYLAAVFALVSLAIYDLINRQGDRNRIYLPAFAATGAISGWLIQLVLKSAGLDTKLASALTFYLGDTSLTNPETGKQLFEASNLLTNWPQWFSDYPQHLGWFIGLLTGVIVYFCLYGKFRNGASLFVYMGMGFMISFLLLPVLGSLFFTGIGGIRMTPPRSDNWAAMIGVFGGLSLWMWQNNLKPVAMAALISGTIGGLGFSGIQWLKQLLTSFGNPRILEAKGILPGSKEFIEITGSWSRWQGQNWHSFLEQSYGFVNGIAIAVALGYLVTRINFSVEGEDRQSADSKKGRWTVAFSTLFVLLGLTYLNVFKNVQVWSEQLNPKVWQQVITHADGTTESVPALWDFPFIGRLPGIDFLSMTPSGWFNLTWVLLVIACAIIVRRHYKSPLPLIPSSSLAKGQLMFLLLLWIMVIANFERALTGWAPGRLITEWVIMVNALISTVLVLLLPQNEGMIHVHPEFNIEKDYRQTWRISLIAMVVSALFFLTTNRAIYQYRDFGLYGNKNYHTRFGPDASWRTKPILKNGDHK